MNGNALSPAAARDAHGHEGKDHDRDFTHVYRTTPVTPRLYKLVVGAWIYACAVAIYTHYPDEHGRIASLAHLYYQAPFIALLAMWLWGINLWAWCVLIKLHPHPLVVFELDDARTIRHREVFKCVLPHRRLRGSLRRSSSKCAGTGVDDDLAKVMPVGLYVGALGALFVPAQIWYAPSRRFLALLQLMAPMNQPVGFADFFLADVACSMAKSFSDVERAVCSMLAGKVMAAVDGDGTCGSTSWKIPLALAVPSDSALSVPSATQRHRRRRVRVQRAQVPQRHARHRVVRGEVPRGPYAVARRPATRVDHVRGGQHRVLVLLGRSTRLGFKRVQMRGRGGSPRGVAAAGGRRGDARPWGDETVRSWWTDPSCTATRAGWSGRWVVGSACTRRRFTAPPSSSTW